MSNRIFGDDRKKTFSPRFLLFGFSLASLWVPEIRESNEGPSEYQREAIRIHQDAFATSEGKISPDNCLIDYFKCLQSAIFISVISPAPEMRFISRSFFPMAIAVGVEDLPVF
jgi:hypothetical protein